MDSCNAYDLLEAEEQQCPPIEDIFDSSTRSEDFLHDHITTVGLDKLDEFVRTEGSPTQPFLETPHFDDTSDSLTTSTLELPFSDEFPFHKDMPQLRMSSSPHASLVSEVQQCLDEPRDEHAHHSCTTGTSRRFISDASPCDPGSTSAFTMDIHSDDLEQNIRSIQNCFAESAPVSMSSVRTRHVSRKEVQKPPTTAGIGLEDLKAVFHLERPKAEKKLRLKRTTFSNLSRHYGISKWPFRTIRDAMNRMQANDKLLKNSSLSKEKRRKVLEQQRLLSGVINLIYTDPRESKDSNTLAVLLRIVAAREESSHLSVI